jgi:hypothetical protein
LIGATVDIHVMADCLEVRQGEELVETVPRLRGRHKKLMNYRHLIEWFARREGAFVTYRHRDAMFPTSRFRRAYDALRTHFPARATKNYLRILKLAATESEAGVDAVLGQLLEWGAPLAPTFVEEHLHQELRLRGAIDAAVATVHAWTKNLPRDTRILSHKHSTIALQLLNGSSSGASPADDPN